MLSLTAREADSINLNPSALPDGNSVDMQDASAEATAQKIAWIREEAGECFAQIELSTELDEGLQARGSAPYRNE